MSLADQIIEHGPVESHDQVPRWFEALTAANINALRYELLELRQRRAADETRERIRVEGVFACGPELSVQCACRRWTVHSERPHTLAELVRRADQHGEECR